MMVARYLRCYQCGEGTSNEDDAVVDDDWARGWQETRITWTCTKGHENATSVNVRTVPVALLEMTR